MNMTQLNWIGIAVTALLCLPEILYSVKFGKPKNRCRNVWIRIMDSLSAVMCTLMMAYRITPDNGGYPSRWRMVYAVVVSAAILVYYFIRMKKFFDTKEEVDAEILGWIAAAAYMTHAILLRNAVLLVSGAVYGVFHMLYVHECYKKLPEDEEEEENDNPDPFDV